MHNKSLHTLYNVLCLSALVLTSLSLSGCFSRQMLGFQTHPEKEVVLMETLENRNYLFWSTHEHVYWSCAENDDTLRCTRRCGGNTDLLCPELSIFQRGVGTNVR